MSSKLQVSESRKSWKGHGPGQDRFFSVSARQVPGMSMANAATTMRKRRDLPFSMKTCAEMNALECNLPA